MRYIRTFILALLAIVLVTIALANREPLTLRLLPEALQGLFGLSWQITLPTFVILLATIMMGVLLGFVWEWVREHRYRSAAAQERKERLRLEAERAKAAPAPEKDIVAYVDSRAVATR